MTETARKHTGTALCILFAAYIISTLTGMSDAEYESSTFKIMQACNMVISIITAAAILYTAFSKKTDSGILTKVLACAATVNAVLSVVDISCYLLSGEYFVAFGYSTFIIYRIAVTIIFILFIFSTRAWLPTKLAITAAALPEAMYLIAYTNLQNGAEIDEFISTLDTVNTLNLIIYIISLTLTIIWLTGGRKTPVRDNRPPMPPQQKSTLIDKIPHK